MARLTRQHYIDAMGIVIDDVATLVETGLNEAMGFIETGRNSRANLNRRFAVDQAFDLEAHGFGGVALAAVGGVDRGGRAPRSRAGAPPEPTTRRRQAEVTNCAGRLPKNVTLAACVSAGNSAPARLISGRPPGCTTKAKP